MTIKKIKVGNVEHDIAAKYDGNEQEISNVYMTKVDPTGTGTLSLNRKANTTVGDFSVAEGFNPTASGTYSHAEGAFATASGEGSHAEGDSVIASGDYSHAEGESVTALGYASHAEGVSVESISDTITSSSTNDEIITAYNNGDGFLLAKGEGSHAEGSNTLALEDYSHAEGEKTIASGEASHAEGNNTTASGGASHAEGYLTLASGYYSHAEGEGTRALGNYSHAEGSFTTVSEDGGEAHAEGSHTKALKGSSHAEGFYSTASGVASHAEGYNTIAEQYGSHAEGYETKASGYASHSEGYNTTAFEDYSHAEGSYTIASGNASHAEGNNTTASGDYSHAEGSGSYLTIKLKKIQGDYGVGYSLEDRNLYGSTVRQGDVLKYNNKVAIITSLNPNASPEITITPSESLTFLPAFDSFYEVNLASGGVASGENSHAEGFDTVASGDDGSHAEGNSTTASGDASHAEGSATTASNFTSHAEGAMTTASGSWAHAEGFYATASGDASHAGGIVTIAAGEAQTVIGKYNIEDTDNTYAFIIGNGENYYDTTDFVYKDRRSNAFAVEWDGTIHVGDKKLIDIIYPVGAVYISYVSTSPASLFGGTWTQISGYFPYFTTSTATGGSNTHTLTTAQMPAHNHVVNLKLTAKKVESGSVISRLNETGTATASLTSVGNTGGGGSHNNMPAYQGLYAWRRTA